VCDTEYEQPSKASIGALVGTVRVTRTPLYTGVDLLAEHRAGMLGISEALSNGWRRSADEEGLHTRFNGQP
jgi:hypothetical protein